MFLNTTPLVESGFFDVVEASSYLRISKSHLYRLTSSGRIRHFKPAGKIIYFRKQDLDEYIMAFEVKPSFEIDQIARSSLMTNSYERKKPKPLRSS